MAPRKIMIIRHAERPGDEIEAVGVNLGGIRDDNSLIVCGWQRAGALARFFTSQAGGAQNSIERPTVLFGARPTAKHPSTRTLDTLQPLSQLMELDVNTDFGRGDETALAAAIKQVTGNVLVAWEHKAIPIILNGLAAWTKPVPDWPDDRFDMVYLVTFDPGPELVQIPQQLLAGDRPTLF